MLSCQTESTSSNIASNAWLTLSSSSISRTQRLGCCKARSNGPAVKNFWLCNSCLSISHSMGPDFERSSTTSLCKASSNLPMAFSSLISSNIDGRSPRLTHQVTSALKNCASSGSMTAVFTNKVSTSSRHSGSIMLLDKTPKWSYTRTAHSSFVRLRSSLGVRFQRDCPLSKKWTAASSRREKRSKTQVLLRRAW